MLEKVMELHFLLYAMMLMGGLGALGMLTTHLTYRRMIRKIQRLIKSQENGNLWKTRDRLLNRMNRFVWYPSLFCIAFLGLAFFSVFQRCTMGRNAAGISLCGCDYSDSIAFAETGAGFYIQRRTSDEFFF